MSIFHSPSAFPQYTIPSAWSRSEDSCSSTMKRAARYSIWCTRSENVLSWYCYQRADVFAPSRPYAFLECLEIQKHHQHFKSLRTSEYETSHIKSTLREDFSSWLLARRQLNISTWLTVCSKSLWRCLCATLGTALCLYPKRAGISTGSIPCSSAWCNFSFEEQFAQWQNSDSSKVT